MIRMLVNLADYYRLINQTDFCEGILSTCELYCENTKLYDALIDILLCRCALYVEFKELDKIDSLFKRIDAYFALFNKDNKKKYLMTRYLEIKAALAEYHKLVLV